ncbi:hypothetical protein E1A91_D02G218600v1 [Gossypium mustelinum]|uniref:non-specific serine/threonine protein kinase n=1 Tax=Gossypium mustelinum TaxID=34275 RepID=A0A5D2W0T9_GOSMU|nr:hypothetical protein E1A91_D02G218600v1 [Gossypium mustelinum]
MQESHAVQKTMMIRTSRWSVVLHILSVILSPLHGCSARDTITMKSSVVDGQTLVSAENRFELGFFGPSRSSNVKRYVGIWYTSNPQTVVWVANREKPLSDKSGVLHIANGYLKLSDKKGKVYWHTGQYKRSNITAKLNDTGNLILYDVDVDGLERKLWQSFEHPTDTFLFGMKNDVNLVLTSWTSEDDPAPGNFIFKQDPQANRLVVMNKSIIYWRSWRESGKIFELVNNLNITEDDTQVHKNERIVMNFTGDLQYWQFDRGMKDWSLTWWEPKDRCSKYNYCGNFGSCNINSKLPCKCLPGFKPKISEKWNAGEFVDGCSRNSTSYGTDFLSLKRMKLEYTESPFIMNNGDNCNQECLSNNQCQAYTVNASKTDRQLSCLTWTEELKNIQEDQDDGYDLYVRVPVSDIAPTSRSCLPCGTNLVPYPLSTGPNCGDPVYYSFDCDMVTGQLSFMTPSGNYTVTHVNPKASIFDIEMQAKEAVNCHAMHSSGSKILQLNRSSPFNVTSSCSSNFTNDSPLKSTIEVKITWKPPLEPTCNSSADCKEWPHSTCNITGTGQKRCLCNSAFRWDGLGLTCSPAATGQLRDSFNKSKTLPLYLIVSLPIAMALLCAILSIYLWRTKMVKKRAKQRKAHLHRYDTERGVKELMESSHLEGKDGTGIDVPFFDFESILAATDNFSDEKKLGRGGFGPVYKGKFPGGQEIAIKRLASVSGQGLEEFKNEVVLIAKLQHRNLVRLLGYCIKGEEKILLYEYLPNKSLDFFIFDESLSQQLEWGTRFNIILGVARGLLYLHQDSRLRIIHRDLKTSNILLDEEMSPKISDFGLARMIQGKQTEGSTLRVVGTYGYMAPEYAIDGVFSVKSDVFSFGVVMLEIISGKKNMRFYYVENTPSLIAYAWRLWQEGKPLDLMDSTLRSSCNASEVLRCVHVGLLCLQEDPSERPTMSNVVVLLGSETASLPIPKQPAFVTRTTLSSTASMSSKAESKTEITSTLHEGR